MVFDTSVPEVELRAAVHGFPACLSLLTATDEPRVIQGLAVDCVGFGVADADRRSDVRRFGLRIVPHLWLLRDHGVRRVFEGQSAVDIACALLGAAGIPFELRLEPEDYPPLPYVEQVWESDLDFLNYVLAMAGIFYYFEHANGFLDSLLPGAGQVAALAGGLLGGVVEMASEMAGASTKLILCDLARRTTSLPTSPLLAAAGDLMAEGLRAIGGPIASTAAAIVEGVADAPCSIPYDADGTAASARERFFAFRARSQVRPKEVRVQAWDPVDHRGVDLTARAAAVTARGELRCLGVARRDGQRWAVGTEREPRRRDRCRSRRHWRGDRRRDRRGGPSERES